MNIIMKRISVLLLTVALMTSLVNTSAKAESASGTSSKPKYVFYLIGDGLGASQRQFAEYYLQEKTGNKSAKLTINTFDVAGFNTTHSADTLVTDSAAAGTALATGHKTNNGVISQKPDGTKVKSLIECAEDAGMATGLISTTRLTHATPAVFAAHNANRNNESEIAASFVESDVDFFAGGGLRYFLPQGWTESQTDAMGKTIKSKREDDRNLFKEFADKGYTTYYGKNGAKNFMATDMTKVNKVFATFTYSHIPYEIDRINTENNVPSLADMVKKGIDVLSQDKDGFFLMVEAGRIDHACHANDASGTILDTLAYDDAVKVAYEFYKKHPEETLLVSLGDHETGGMGLGFGTNYFLKMNNLFDVKVSVADVLQGVYDGDRAAIYTYLAENFGLKDLTDNEKSRLEKAMDIIDNEDEDTAKALYASYNPLAMEASHILSERANVQWTTYAHTGTAIPMSAHGTGAEVFGGFKDNTEVARTMAKLMDFELTK